jgi:putative ABC transport system substrate-binding protein
LIGYPLRARPATKIPRVAILSARTRPARLEEDANLSYFVRGMRELGYVENQTVRYDARYAGGNVERLPALAAELAAAKPDVILAAGNQAIAAAQKAAPRTPIVIATAIDPVGSGFARSLAHPAGNITGLSNLTSEVSAKHVEILSSFVPRLSRVAVLMNPSNSAHDEVVASLRSAAASAHIDLMVARATTAPEVEHAFAEMERQKAGGLVVVVDGFFTQQAGRIAALALNSRLPSIDASGALARAGGLAGYGQDFRDNYYRAAAFVDKILKGAAAGDIPIEQSTKFTLVVNRKTAKALGIAVPESIMLRTDRFID